MAYEVIFTCHPKKQDGKGYNLEETELFTKKLGSITDDISLEELASLILKQMARRDKLITDVEIYEFTKKKLSFKEVDGGVIIKNKKFILDESSLSSTTMATTEGTNGDVPEHQSRPVIPQTLTNVRYEVFSPDPNDLPMLQKRGFKLTIGHRYAITKETTNITKAMISGTLTEIPTIDYEVQDDAGNRVKVPSILFVPESKGLVAQRLLDEVDRNRRGGGTLSYQGAMGPEMPVIRRNY